MCGHSDVPLDATGLAQVSALGAALAATPLSAVISSPLLRARQTPEALLAGRDLPLGLAPELIELDHGALDGVPSKQALREHPEFFEAWMRDPGAARVPGGETLAECQTRAMSALRTQVEVMGPGPPIALVTHQLVLASILCEVLDLPLRHYRLLSQKNTAINALSFRDGAWRVRRLNVTSHLPDLC